MNTPLGSGRADILNKLAVFCVLSRVPIYLQSVTEEGDGTAVEAVADGGKGGDPLKGEGGQPLKALATHPRLTLHQGIQVDLIDGSTFYDKSATYCLEVNIIRTVWPWIKYLSD